MVTLQWISDFFLKFHGHGNRLLLFTVFLFICKQNVPLNPNNQNFNVNICEKTEYSEFRKKHALILPYGPPAAKADLNEVVSGVAE